MSRTAQILREAGLSKTETRITLLELFLDSETALSLPTIEDRVQSIDRVTLYRNLRAFEGKGIIHKAHDVTNHPKYALCDQHCGEHNHHDNHPHFHCVKCEKTVCLEEIATPRLSQLPPGYQIHQSNMILSGICPSCDPV